MLFRRHLHDKPASIARRPRGGADKRANRTLLPDKPDKRAIRGSATCGGCADIARKSPIIHRSLYYAILVKVAFQQKMIIAMRNKGVNFARAKGNTQSHINLGGHKHTPNNRAKFTIPSPLGRGRQILAQ